MGSVAAHSRNGFGRNSMTQQRLGEMSSISAAVLAAPALGQPRLKESSAVVTSAISAFGSDVFSHVKMHRAIGREAERNRCYQAV